MRSLADMLQARIGLDPASIGTAAIDRAARHRAALHTGGDVDAYVRHLDEDADEFQALVDAVVVPETWFFRYPESIAAMTTAALQRLAARPATPLRILSLPCSTGEEPYTIAMALLDAGVAPARFRIDAADISARNVVAADAAQYRSNSFRGADLAFRDRHFVRTGMSYTLSPAVRGQVRLSRENLLSPTLGLPVDAYDFVFCRNLLIYFDVATQARSIHILAGLAKRDGLLFVGPAEASVLTRMQHRSIGVPMAFAFHALPAASADPARDEWPPTPPDRPSLPPARPAQPWRAAALASPLPFARPAREMPLPIPFPAKPAFSAPSVADDEAAASFAAMNALADQGRFDDALRACQVHLAQFGPSATAFYRQGLFNDAARRHDEARDAYRKALYLDPAHPQALLQLAALLEADGDAAGAARLRQRLRRHEATQ